uniref:Putative ovule protein n=1 Tax=Solanum chacoense TaxID=4108 RepID=A0A0V0GYM2_SOLCH
MSLQTLFWRSLISNDMLSARCHRRAPTSYFFGLFVDCLEKHVCLAFVFFFFVSCCCLHSLCSLQLYLNPV